MNRGQDPHRVAAAHRSESGFLYGIGAYFLWGVLPIYFKQIAHLGALDIVAHRVVWSLPFLIVLIALRRRWKAILAVLADRRTLALLALSAILIATNWLLYVYSVVGGYILAASLGYYLNPLANVLMGRFLLGEKLSRLQWAAVAIAAAGIAVLAAGAVGHLWISLTLCISFATYGLIRKTVPAEAVPGLFFETLWLFPIGLGWLVMRGWSGAPAFGQSSLDTTLLLFAGIVSTIPLLMFTAAARRLAYSTLGMLQFLAPTLQFLLAVFLYGERFTLAHAITFAAIWTALFLYVAALLKKPRLPVPPE